MRAAWATYQESVIHPLSAYLLPFSSLSLSTHHSPFSMNGLVEITKIYLLSVDCKQATKRQFSQD